MLVRPYYSGTILDTRIYRKVQLFAVAKYCVTVEAYLRFALVNLFKIADMVNIIVHNTHANN